MWGDSVLGYKAHFGAGVITANVRGDRAPVTVRDGADAVATGLKKFGAMVGDLAEIGCNSVLCPGCVIGRGTQVYPLSRSCAAGAGGQRLQKAGRGCRKAGLVPGAAAFT